MTRISVCMATYNGEKYIQEQIESILCQLDSNDEIIISDDGSTDHTTELIRSFQDERIKLIFHEPTGYYTSNFENSLVNASGEYIFLVDQDDVWMPNKVAVCLDYLSKYDFVMTNAYVVDENLHITQKSRNDFYNIRSGFWNNFIKSRYLGCCFAFNRGVLDRALPFPPNHDLSHHDTWISLIAESLFKTVVIPEPLIMYRRHTSNTSTGGETRSSIYKVIKIRGYLLWWLLKRRLMKKIKS